MARIEGFITREQWGARRPRSVSHNITPGRGGCTKHYGGDGGPPSTHTGCIARWKSWQDFHMDGRGWVDIAYTAGYCNHGYVLAGRGYGVRTAANGTDTGNQNWYAFTWVGGGTATPSPAALSALDWLVADARLNGAAGDGFNNHRDHKPTGCPGDYLAGYRLDTPSTEDPMPTLSEITAAVKAAVPNPWTYGFGRGDARVTAGQLLARSARDSAAALAVAREVASRPASASAIDPAELERIITEAAERIEIDVTVTAPIT